MIERRTHQLAYRVFRFTLHKSVRRTAVVMMAIGWTLMLWAQSQPNPTTPGTGISELSLIATLVGGFLMFMAMFGGISYWVAEPAARKVLAEHIKDGANAHVALVSREEWDRKHLELMAKMNDLKSEISNLTTEVRIGKQRR